MQGPEWRWNLMEETMSPFCILSAAFLLLVALLAFEAQNQRTGVLATKTPLSILFVVTAWIQAAPPGPYARLLVVGLLFCLGGDVLLALAGRKAFLAGLVSFLLGHVFYVLAFFSVGEITWCPLGPATVGVVGAGGWVWHGLRPHLGGMKRPVAGYIVVISLMVCGAFVVLGTSALGRTGRGLVLAGALCFYVSDLFVARDRFVRKGFANRLFGLPLYYGGQFLLAFSPAYLA
jgi:uncharacterized membrane protein YhhN